jgi:hypothetical protein
MTFEKIFWVAMAVLIVVVLPFGWFRVAAPARREAR